MQTREIEEKLRQYPFVPFRLRLRDGRSYVIRHPRMMVVFQTVVAVSLLEEPGHHVEDIVICDPRHITGVEALNGGQQPPRSSR